MAYGKGKKERFNKKNFETITPRFNFGEVIDDLDSVDMGRIILEGLLQEQEEERPRRRRRIRRRLSNLMEKDLNITDEKVNEAVEWRIQSERRKNWKT